MADSELERKLALIKQDYLVGLPQRAEQLQAAWTQAESQTWSGAPLSELHRLVHSLSGSGKTFGCDELSERAHALELQLNELLRGKPVDLEGLPGLRDALLTALAVAAATHG